MITLNGKTIDASVPFKACCSVCFKDTDDCLPISYPFMENLYKELGARTVAFAVCKHCFETSDRRFLYDNLKDYFVVNELRRWIMGDRDGIVRSHLSMSTQTYEPFPLDTAEKIRKVFFEGLESFEMPSILHGNKVKQYLAKVK